MYGGSKELYVDCTYNVHVHVHVYMADICTVYMYVYVYMYMYSTLKYCTGGTVCRAANEAWYSVLSAL